MSDNNLSDFLPDKNSSYIKRYSNKDIDIKVRITKNQIISEKICLVMK